MKTTSEMALMPQLAAARPPEEQKAFQRVMWTERLTSLWSPLLVFALVFAPYILLVELAPQSAGWAQPLLKLFGLLMVLWFIALALHRVAFAEARKLRRLRVEAGELLGQMDRELRRLPKESEAQRTKIVSQAQALDRARLGNDATALETELGKLSSVADKAVAGWRKRGTVDGMKGLFWTLLAVLALRTVLVEPYRIPTGSMLPTLNLGDHVVVNRFVYGVRIPFVNIVPFPIIRRPARGDVIVFNNPLNTAEDFIKRVIAVPGDTVEIVESVVILNGVPQPRTLVERSFEVNNRDEGGPWYSQRFQLFTENLDGHEHAVLRDPTLGTRREGPWTVPEGHVFVMGDNRDNSADSRRGFGVIRDVAFVPYGNIKGKAMVIWLSWSRGGVGHQLFGSGLRTDRLFTPVQ